MAKANQMTWRHADGFHSHIVRSSNKRRLRQHLPSLPCGGCASQDEQASPEAPLSPLSLPLKVDKAFLC